MKRAWLGVAALIGLITLVLEIIYRHAAHPHYMWHATPLFDLIFGFIGCAIIVLASKWIGHAWLQRDETYYGDDPS